MRRPARVDSSATIRLIEECAKPLGWPFNPRVAVYCVNARCGRAKLDWETGEARVTVPRWAFHSTGANPRPFSSGFALYYLAHELAHIANMREFGKDHDIHGPNFMRHFKAICPPHLWHYELGYKPRNATAAGIKDAP